VIEESSLIRSILTPEPAATGEPLRARAARAGTPTPFLARPARQLPLDEALRRRRSVRTFAAEPVSVAELESITRQGLAAERACWPPGAHPAVGLTFAAAAFGVRELEPGLYLAGPDRGNFAVLPQEEGSLAEFQAECGPAPVTLFVCGSLAQACAGYGQSGYPQLLVRAGAAGYGAWLAAVAAGLAGCAYGRTSHRVTAAVNRHGGCLRHLFTVAIGRPLEDDADDQ
jgi:hypothetical protein